MRKVLLMMVCVWMIGWAAKAQSGWSLTPEAGITAVQRVNGDGWRPGVKVGANFGYQFEPKWIGLKFGLLYTNRGYSMQDHLVSTEYLDGSKWLGLEGGSITQHFLQLPVMADFSWKVKNVRMHLGIGMYAGVSLANNWEWGSSYGFTVQSPTGPEKMSGGDNSYEYLYDDGPFSNLNSFDWGLTTSFGVEVDNWVMNVGYELSLGDEGDNYSRKWMNGGSYEVRSIGSNYNTLSLTVGYKFKLGK